jgi:signal transduction histidine kinase
VDEQREGLARLETCFAPLGHELVLAHSSEEALRELLRRDLALVVVAGSSGPETARRIRQHARGRGVSMLVLGKSADPGPAIPRTPDAAPLEMLESGVDTDLLRSRAALLVDLQIKTRRIKSLERTARQRAREARQAMIVRDQFLSVASHELRTPLTSLKLEIANLARMVRRNDSKDSTHLVPRVERIEAQASRLHRLIDDLLDASRIAAGRLELVLEEVDLSAVAEDVVARFDHEAARLGSTLSVRAPVPVIGYWDRSRVDQLLSNLVSNAIKYGDGKPIEVTVEVTPEVGLLRVRDNGVGIAAQDQARIFERFERAASLRNYGGVGLGLWSVHKIVDALGGTVSVDSQPELGSTFTVLLPRVRPTARAEIPCAADRAPDSLTDAAPRS